MADTATTVTAEQLADRMLVLIRDDLGDGDVPPGVRTFSELHDFVDANDYLIQAREGLGLPAIDESEPEPDFALDNAACDLVTSRLELVAREFPQRRPCAVESKFPHYKVCRGCGWRSERGYGHEDSIIIQYSRDAYGVVLSGNDGDGYALYWSDFVANDWTERYGTLPLALARAAALEYAVAHERFFTDDPVQFVMRASAWLEGRSG